MKSLKLFVLYLILTGAVQSQTCHESGSEVHGMPPIGVMNGHTHGKGHMMASYRFMTMSMNGVSHQGTMMSTSEALGKYAMMPRSMRMDMHMLGVMYAPLERLTLGIMANYNLSVMTMESTPNHSMDHDESHDHGDHMSTTTMTDPSLTISEMRNSGIGDIKVSGLFRVLVSASHCLHAIGGVSIPTGSVDAGDQMHPILPYAMQNGTGSMGAYAGLNYSWLFSKYLIGAQALSAAPLFANKRGYLAPVKHELNLWGSRRWAKWVSSSVRLRGFYQTGVRGSDVLVSKTMSPLGHPANQEQWVLETMMGLNFMPFDHWRLAVEGGIPAFQWNQGVAMDRQWLATVGLQFMMH